MPLKQLQVTDVDFPFGEPDVQRTTLSLDVIGRYVCSTFAEATTNPDFDVIVVGAGMYGAYAAAKIHSEGNRPGRTPLRVLVLEAGPFLVHEHGQNIPDLGLSNPFRPVLDPFSEDAGKTRNLVWGMGWRGNVGFPGTAYCVGGKSIYWGGWCPRLRASDLAQWPAEARDYLTAPPPTDNLPNRRAPPGRASVYEAVEYEIGVQPADDYVFDPVAGPDDPPDGIGLNDALGARLRAVLPTLRAAPAGAGLGDLEPPPIAVQTQSFVSGVFSPDKYSSLTHLMAARRSEAGKPDGQAGLFVVPNAHVCRLAVGRAARDGADIPSQSIEAIDLVAGGVRERLALKPTATVVLALGCIESTRLALESFPTASRREGDEIMGRNLMAHLRFDFPFTIDRARFADWVRQHTDGKTLRDELQTASFHLQADTPDGRFHLQIYATGEDQGSEEGLLYRMIPNPEIAEHLAAMQARDKVRLVFRACGEIRGDRAKPVHAAGTNWIDLASAADRDGLFDHERAFVHYEDQRSNPIWARMRNTCVALAQELGADAIPPEDRHEVGSTWHDAGTLFMGDDPDASVTDTSGHFHHVLNAVCVDQAIYPTVGSANPVLTGLCLARKAAETLAGRRLSESVPDEAQRAREMQEGFVDLLTGADAQGTFARRWRPNDPRFTDGGRPFLIERDAILEVHGEAGLGILFFDHADLFGDFELRLQWKAFLEPGTGGTTANSGVFLRAPAPAAQLDQAGFYARAIEVQIDDTGYDAANRRFGSPLHRTGAVYGHCPARLHAQKQPSTEGTPGLWNEYRILARGRDVSVRLNGRIACEGTVPAASTGPGLIGVQYHTGKVQFRSIRIKRL